MRINLQLKDKIYNINLNSSTIIFGGDRTTVITNGDRIEFDTTDSFSDLISSVTGTTCIADNATVTLPGGKTTTPKRTRDTRLSFLFDEKRDIWLKTIHEAVGNRRLAVTMSGIVEHGVKNLDADVISGISTDVPDSTSGWESNQYGIKPSVAKSYRSVYHKWTRKNHPHQVVNAMIKIYARDHNIDLQE